MIRSDEMEIDEERKKKTERLTMMREKGGREGQRSQRAEASTITKRWKEREERKERDIQGRSGVY